MSFIKNIFSGVKKKSWGFLLKKQFLRKPSLSYCRKNRLLPQIITATSSEILQEMLFLPASSRKTQENQDFFALLVNQFKPGYFIEIGANDGFTFSNTLYLEEYFEWSGLLIEANPKYADSLSQRKNVKIINKAISDQSGIAQFVDAGLYGGLAAGIEQQYSVYTNPAPIIHVDCLTLQQVFDEACVPMVIDFLSIDVEGGELPIVRQLVSDQRRARCGCIEVNHRKEDMAEIKQLLNGAGYKIAWEGMTKHDLFFVDPLLCPIQTDEKS